MHKLILSTIAVASLVGAAATPELASAYTRHHRYHGSSYAERRHEQSCESARRRRANNGTLIGGIGGALVGHAVGGHGIGGTLVGGGLGAVAGHSIADKRKGNC